MGKLGEKLLGGYLCLIALGIVMVCYCNFLSILLGIIITIVGIIMSCITTFWIYSEYRQKKLKNKELLS